MNTNKKRILMTKPAWWDIDKRGRSWNAIYKSCETNYWKAMNSNDFNLAEAYFRRMSIIEKLIQPYVIDVTNIRRIINEYNKQNPPQLIFRE